MLNIDRQIDADRAVYALAGKMDTLTAPEFESVLAEDMDNVREMTFDFSELEYVSSAGLRVILTAYKTMTGKGSLVLRNVRREIMDIFETTGFIDFLTIENNEEAEETNDEEED